MSFKRTKVVMLPTNQRAKRGDLTMFGGRLVIASSVLHLAQPAHQLYFLSEDEIQIGDWCIMLDSFENVFSTPQHYFDPNTQHLNDGLRKIIASTDNELNPSPSYLPKPSQSFIERFVEMYNLSHPIKEVLVEYVDDVPKVKDNTITIKKVIDTFTTKQVIDLMTKSYHCGYADRDANTPQFHGTNPTEYLNNLL